MNERTLSFLRGPDELRLPEDVALHGCQERGLRRFR